MKKGLLAFIIVILSIIITPVYADEFETLFKMDSELKDNTFTIQLGIREASTMAVMSNIAYNQDKLEFVSIDANEYFTVTKSKDINNGSFKSFKILADSDYGFQKVYYANLTFRIKGLEKGERTDIYFNNNQVATADEIIKTSPSIVYTLYYDKEGTVSYVVSERNFMTNLNIYLTNHWKFVLIVIFVLIGLFIFIRYWIIIHDIKIFNKKHEHNHIVEKMKFAKVPVNLQTVDVDEKPEKIRIAKLGKWGKKKVKETPQENKNEDTLAKLMAEDVQEEVKSNVPERGVFVGNQDMGNDNELPDDFSSFGKASSTYAYDDDKIESEISDEEAVNLDDLSNISLTDEDDKNNNGTKIGLFLGLLIVSSLFNIKSVNALNEEEMGNLRNMILGNMTWSAEYDINNDNTIDMLDIIALKDINNITIIQDSMTVEDSKEGNNFVIKSTSKYVRTTKPGQTKVRTTADGKWKNDNNNKNNNNSNPDNPSQHAVLKEPEIIDTSDGTQETRKITVEYRDCSGDYKDITVPFAGEITFNIYSKSEGYQKPVVSVTASRFEIQGTYPNIKLRIYDVVNDTTVKVHFGATNTINATLKTGARDYTYTNQQPGQKITQSVQLDSHYDYGQPKCNGGFVNASISDGHFRGTIADYSGTCTLEMTPKHYSNVIRYNGQEMYSFNGNYNSTINNVSMFSDSLKSNKLKLYCGNSDPVEPKKVEWAKQSVGGITYEGYRYIFDVKVTGSDCELR